MMHESMSSIVHDARRQRAARFARRGSTWLHRGFTMVEMVVVIGIMVALFGVIVAVSTAVSRHSAISETENILILLDKAIAEWQLAAQRQLTYGVNNSTANIMHDVNATDFAASNEASQRFILSRVLNRISSNKETMDLLTTIDSKYFKRNEGEPQADRKLTIQDPWDNNIRVVFPGRQWMNTDPPTVIKDPDGTIRTELENRYGICRQKKITFISAGPDGNFGHLHLDVAQGALSPAQQAEVKFAADNIASDDLDETRP